MSKINRFRMCSPRYFNLCAAIPSQATRRQRSTMSTWHRWHTRIQRPQWCWIIRLTWPRLRWTIKRCSSVESCSIITSCCKTKTIPPGRTECSFIAPWVRVAVPQLSSCTWCADSDCQWTTLSSSARRRGRKRSQTRDSWSNCANSKRTKGALSLSSEFKSHDIIPTRKYKIDAEMREF